jgi:hypothetical protein
MIDSTTITTAAAVSIGPLGAAYCIWRHLRFSFDAHLSVGTREEHTMPKPVDPTTPEPAHDRPADLRRATEALTRAVRRGAARPENGALPAGLAARLQWLEAQLRRGQPPDDDAHG